MEQDRNNLSWKQKLRHEFIEYWINVAYLALFFSVFILYRRMILAHYDIYLQDYFFGVIKALVFAKVIMIGGFLRIGKRIENKPLIISVFYKAFLFTIWVAVFDIVEKFISGFIHTVTISGATAEALDGFNTIWLGGAIVVFFSFIPFFTYKELSRVIGPEEIQDLLFRKRAE